MKAAKTELAKRRAWLGVTALGMLACSLALAGAPVRKSAPSVTAAAGQAGRTTTISQPAEAAPLAGASSDSPITKQRVHGGQMPQGEFQIIATMVVDYRDDEMTKARARGELVGPLPMKSAFGGVAAGGCTFNIECDDANPCRIDTCSFVPGSLPGTGKCVYDPVPDDFNSVVNGCDDDNYCNGFESCQNAFCAAGSLGMRCDGGDNDGEDCALPDPPPADCPGGSCVTVVGLTCASHDDCRTPGVCNTTTGQCTSGDTGACATNHDCGDPSSGSCNPGNCMNGIVPSCCTNRDGCFPDFATCDKDSDNEGDACEVDANCRGGKCNRCAGLCASAADCADDSKCNGVESCTGFLCRGGANNGNTCTDDAGCPKRCAGGARNGLECASDANCGECSEGGPIKPCQSNADCTGTCVVDGSCEGSCLGTCVRGLNPCGYQADCEEGRCSAGANANKLCNSDGECPGGYCSTLCTGGPQNGKACGDCPGGSCNITTRICTGGGNAGRGCGVCDGVGVCGTGPVCFLGRCCLVDDEPECFHAYLFGGVPLCTANWYAGDGGNDLRDGIDVGLCGGGNADRSDPWGCPKYSGGLTQLNLNNPPQRLVTVGPVSDATICVPGPGGSGNNGTGGDCLADPLGPTGAFNKIGDDYTLTNSSHIGLDVMRWVGGALTAADRILIEFYDTSGILIEDIVMAPLPSTDIGVIVVQFSPALTIPPTGFVTARVASNFSPNTRFVWASTNAAVVGANNPSRLWINCNGFPSCQGHPPTSDNNFLSPHPGILAFELVGDKVALPVGACCNALSGECTDGVLSWQCAAQGNIFNGVTSLCAACNGGTSPGIGGACRKCAAGGPHAGLACTGDAVCGECSEAGTQPCTSGADCTGTCTTGNCVPNDATCTTSPPGTKYCYNNGVIDPNKTCGTAMDCTTGPTPRTCEPPKCVASTVCGSGACCNPVTGGCTYPGNPGSCNGTCTMGACVGGAGDLLPCTGNEDCEFFQGFGTDCDVDNGLNPTPPDPARQHCCPQPFLKGPLDEPKLCMGGPNNLDVCTSDTNCRKCVEGPNDGDNCTVHADCARCIGGTQYLCTAFQCAGGPNDTDACADQADCNPCTTSVDCAGGGVCTGHCLGSCVTRRTGADNCADAFVHVITIPPSIDDVVTITISGNNEFASSTVENPDSCFGIANTVTDDPAWWEAFKIAGTCNGGDQNGNLCVSDAECPGNPTPGFCDNTCAWVRLDFCCTKPVHEPAWAFLATDCACDNLIGNTANPYHSGELGNARGPKYCEEDNLWQSFGPLGPGTYYYPIYSVLAGHHGDYQMHVTVEGCKEAVCCRPDGTCDVGGDLLNQGECDAIGGYFLAPPQTATGIAPCLADTCARGSCCLGPGVCLDQFTDEPGEPDNDARMTLAECTTNHPGATFYGGIRCAGGTCSLGDDHGESCRVHADCEMPGLCTGSTAELAVPNPCPLCEFISDGTCQRDPGEFRGTAYLADTSSTVQPTRIADDVKMSETGMLKNVCVIGTYVSFTNDPNGAYCGLASQSAHTDSFTVAVYETTSATDYTPGHKVGTSATTFDRKVEFTDGGIEFFRHQLKLTTEIGPLVEGLVYWIEVSNNTQGGEAGCNWFWLNARVGEGNGIFFQDLCNAYTVDDANVGDISLCMNLDFETPTEPTRACCAGDLSCEVTNFEDCVDSDGDGIPGTNPRSWQFDQETCSGFVCPVEPNDACDRAPFVEEGVFVYNMFGAATDGPATEQCEAAGATEFGGDIWFYYQPTTSGTAYIGTCSCEGSPDADEVVAIYSSGTTCLCPNDIGFTLLKQAGKNKCHDGSQNNHIDSAGCNTFGDNADEVVQVTAGNCYTVRVASFAGSPPLPGILRIALAPAICGNGTREVAGGEQCDKGNPNAVPPIAPDDDLCDGKCDFNCLCPATVCGKQCVGGSKDGQPCTAFNATQCPGGTACEGKLEAALGEKCDTTAGLPGTAPCTSVNTTCRPPGDPDGECTCVPFCGNGRREGGELCDGSDNDLCGEAGCNGFCRCDTDCGNGILEIGEQCDKGHNPPSDPPAVDDQCKTRCQADCTCPPPSCGNNYTEVLSNDEECDGLDLANESTCPGQQCRPPGDPAGECTCACAGVSPTNVPVWDPAKKSCTNSGADPTKACAVAADCGLCTLKKCSGLPANSTCTGSGTTGTCPLKQCSGTSTTCTGTGQGSCSAGQTCDFTGQTCDFVDCVTTADQCTPVSAGTCTAGPPGVCLAWPNNNPAATTRSLRFTVEGPAGPSKLEAIKVTMVDLQHPKPANLPTQAPTNMTTYDTKLNSTCAGATASPNYNGHHCDVTADCDIASGTAANDGTCTGLVGCTADPACTDPLDCTLPSNVCGRWVGKPGTFYEAQGPPQSGPYRAARLQCTPYYFDWKPEGLITVVGGDIAPSSEYSAQVYGVSCMGAEANCTNVSSPVTMYTRRSGDVEVPFNPPSSEGQPNVTDIAQLVNKVKSLPGAPVKAISQLQPNLPEMNTNINVSDIVAVVDAVKLFKYAYSGPCPCPSLSACGALGCATDTVCRNNIPGLPGLGAGALCVKTCTGPGPLTGEPCLDNTHCVGSGTCGAGFCRDRCGRCTLP